jgi:hypothetical protein
MGVSARCKAAGTRDQRRSPKPQVGLEARGFGPTESDHVAGPPESAAIQDVGTDRVVPYQWFRWRAHNRILFAIAVAGPVRKKDQFSSSLSTINQRPPRDA